MATAASRRSSSSARRLLAVIGGATALALAVLLGWQLLEDDDGGPRRAVASYLDEVNAIQASLAAELTAVSRAYAGFDLAPSALAARADDLAAAEGTLRRLERRAAALEPPEDAARLHAELLGLLRAQTAVAAELSQFARYVPRHAAEEARLATASRSLRAALASTSAAAEQAGAFQAYAQRVDAVARRLGGAVAPPVLAPLRDAEVARATGLAEVARALAEALAGGEDDAVETLLADLDRHVRPHDFAAAQRRAVRAYADRLRAIETRRLAVEDERTRLSLTLR